MQLNNFNFKKNKIKMTNKNKNSNKSEVVISIDRADWTHIVAHNAHEYILNLVEKGATKQDIEELIVYLRDTKPPNKRVYPSMQ
jgi:hypothetical protein